MNRSLLCVLLLTVLGCSSDPVVSPGEDAGPTPLADVGSEALDSGVLLTDAGTADAEAADAAGTSPDAGIEASDVGLAADAGAVDAAGQVPDASVVTGTRVRVLAGNLTSGTAQAYDEGEGIRIFQGLKPDVALIQEFNYGAGVDSDIRAFVDQAFGPEFVYYRESGVDDDLPNGIVSRYPILESGEWDDPASINRDLAWARLDVPGPTDLWVLSLHLRTSNAGDRNLGAVEAVTHLKAVMPAGDYLVIGGDFNTGSRTEKCVTTFSELVRTAAPYPVDQAGNGNTSAKRSTPLDWVLNNDALQARLVPVDIGGNSFPSGLVFDSRLYTPLTDVAPVRATDCAAKNMQHMAVVKDFLLE